MQVYATARRPETLEGLMGAGCQTLALDVTDDDSMCTAVKAITDARGGLDVLVNNAGIGEYGPIEESSIESLRQQLDTNVVGSTRLAQLILPIMRARGGGRVINVGSISGKVTFPATGYYSASKYALEAITDALRFEVRPFGIAVSLIEPGPIKTGFDEAGLEQLRHASDASPYCAFNESATRAIMGAYEGLMGRLAGSPERVARVIESAIRARRPRTRYRVGPAAAMMLTVRKVLPDRMLDLVLRSQFTAPDVVQEDASATPA
jgi:short-subunit dehydrogenase